MSKKRKPKVEPETMMARTVAAVNYINHTNLNAEEQRKAELEAFMSIFHPDKAADRVFMAKLKQKD